METAVVMCVNEDVCTKKKKALPSDSNSRAELSVYRVRKRKIFGIDATRLGVSFEKQHAASQPFVCLILFVDVRNKRPAKSEMRVEFRGVAPSRAAVSNSQQEAVVRGFKALDRGFGRRKLLKNAGRADDRRGPSCSCASFGFGLGQCSSLKEKKRRNHACQKSQRRASRALWTKMRQ